MVAQVKPMTPAIPEWKRRALRAKAELAELTAEQRANGMTIRSEVRDDANPKPRKQEKPR